MIIFLEGCKYTKTYDNGIVFKECHKELYSIGNNEYNFEKISPNTVYDVLYDQFTGKIWIHRIIDENSIFQFIEDDGSLSREIIISYNNIILFFQILSIIQKNFFKFSTYKFYAFS